jgi:hypothetical protein
MRFGPFRLTVLVLALMVAGTFSTTTPTRAGTPNKFVYLPLIQRGSAPAATPGLWKGPANQFYVAPDSAAVKKFAVYVNVIGCGTYKITRSSPVPINNKRFEFINYYFSGSGTFTSPTTANGSNRIYRVYIPGCGYVSGGPWAWSATWRNSSQPTSAAAEDGASHINFVTAAVDVPDGAAPAMGADDSYSVEPIGSAIAPGTAVTADGAAPDSAAPATGADDSYSVEPLP